MVCVLTCLALFFSLNGFSLVFFSRVKLQEAFKGNKKETKFETFAENRDALLLSCSFFGVLTNIAVLVLLGNLLAQKSMVWLIVASFAIIEFAAVIIPYSWAKYTGEKILFYNYRVLMLLLFLSRS